MIRPLIKSMAIFLVLLSQLFVDLYATQLVLREENISLEKTSVRTFDPGERAAYKEGKNYPKLVTVIKSLNNKNYSVRSDSGEVLTVAEKDILAITDETTDPSVNDRVHVIENSKLYIGTVIQAFDNGWFEIKFDKYKRTEIHHASNLTPFDEVTKIRIKALKFRHQHNEKVTDELAVVENQLFGQSGSKGSLKVSGPQKCLVCLDEIKGYDDILTCEACGKSSHFKGCLAPWLTDHVNQMAGGYSCMNCGKPLPFSKLSKNKTLAKRSLAASLDLASTLIPCFRCGKGIIVAEFHDHGLKFQNACGICGFSACHRCGSLHAEMSCVESDQTITGEDIDALIRIYDVENVGGCPRCRQIIIKNDGCAEMTCGKNFHADISNLQSSKTGCGYRFKWEQRLKPVALKKISQNDQSHCCVVL